MERTTHPQVFRCIHKFSDASTSFQTQGLQVDMMVGGGGGGEELIS